MRARSPRRSRRNALSRAQATLLACVLTTSCATQRAPEAWTSTVGPTQTVAIRTDPPGATCSLMRRSGVAATVALALVIAGAREADWSDRPIDSACMPLPEVVLTPATFASESACDAFFAGHQARLEAIAAEERRVIDAECHPWPCRRNEWCANPQCESQRVGVDARLKAALDPILASRAHVRIVAP